MNKKEEDTYKFEMRCDNCHLWEEVEITKGITVGEWLTKEENKICPNCGCERQVQRFPGRPIVT